MEALLTKGFRWFNKTIVPVTRLSSLFTFRPSVKSFLDSLSVEPRGREKEKKKAEEWVEGSVNSTE